MSRKKSTASSATRNTRSRESLLNAAQNLLASHDADLSITSITKTAGVVPQTLYNHFLSKDELLTKAAAQALTEFEKYMFVRGKDISSPLERFVLNLRLYGRAPDTHPHYAAIVVNSPLSVLMGAKGYSPGFAKDVGALIKQGLLKPRDLEIALVATAALLEQAVALRIKKPSIPEKRVDDFVFQCLIIFGITPAKAEKLTHLPLPALL